MTLEEAQQKIVEYEAKIRTYENVLNELMAIFRVNMLRYAPYGISHDDINKEIDKALKFLDINKNSHL